MVISPIKLLSNRETHTLSVEYYDVLIDVIAVDAKAENYEEMIQDESYNWECDTYASLHLLNMARVAWDLV